MVVYSIEDYILTMTFKTHLHWDSVHFDNISHAFTESIGPRDGRHEDPQAYLASLNQGLSRLHGLLICKTIWYLSYRIC